MARHRNPGQTRGMLAPDDSAPHHGATAPHVRVVPRASAPLRPLGVVGLLLALPVVAVVTLWPTHFLLRLKPRVTRGLEWLHARELLEWVYWTRLEALMNIAMFVPLGLLLVLALGARRWWIALGLCLAATVSIEVTQHLLLPGRVASVRDIVANGIGAAIGVALGAVLEGIVGGARRRGRDRALAGVR